MDEVPPFVHEEVVCRSGLRNVEELQTFLVEGEKTRISIYTILHVLSMHFKFMDMYTVELHIKVYILGNKKAYKTHSFRDHKTFLRFVGHLK